MQELWQPCVWAFVLPRPCVFSGEVYHEEYDDGTDQHPYGTGVAVSHVFMDLVIWTGYLQRTRNGGACRRAFL